MESLKETDFAKIQDKIEIISTDDEKIKLVGSLLSNDSSRTILKLLLDDEMTANEIAQKTQMLISLVIHHLQKLQEAGLVKINKIGKNSKGRDMKYYVTTNLTVIIMPSKMSEKAKKSKSLLNTISRIYKFAAIGIAGMISWLVLNIDLNPIRAGMASQNPQSISMGIIAPLLIIIVGLILERIIVEIRK